MCIFHKYDRWKDVQSGDITIKKRSVGRYVMQEKRCEKCGKLKARKVTS